MRRRADRRNKAGGALTRSFLPSSSRAAWGSCLDIAGPHAGVVSACMNTAGQVGGFLSPIILTVMVNQFGDWNIALRLSGALFLVGAVCWLFIDPRRQIAHNHN
jgi:nitrate/nitrite transporter NarK